MQAHEDRNLARKLTPAEKKEKKLKKLVGEANEGDSPQVALYKVMDLSNRQHQFKVRVNAQVSSCSQACLLLRLLRLYRALLCQLAYCRADHNSNNNQDYYPQQYQ